MNNSGKFLIGTVIFFVLLIGLVGCERISVGNVGLKVNLSGGERGVSKVNYVTGWVPYLRLATQVVEYSTRIKALDFAELDVTCSGGTVFKAHPKLTYRVNPLFAHVTFTSFGTDDMSIIESGYLHTCVTKALGDVANRFTPDSLLYSRELYETLVMSEIKQLCDSIGLDVSIFRANLTPDNLIADAINKKQAAIQDNQRIENEKAGVIAQAAKKVAEAKGDSASLVINASAEALANKLKQQTLTDKLLQQQWIDAWRAGGSLVPQYIQGSSAGNFMMSIPK